MTWRRVAVIYTVLAALVLALVVLDRAPAPESPAEDAARPERSLLGSDAARVVGLVLRRAGRSIEARRDDGRWHVVAPAGVSVPPDLLAAAVATLTAGQSAEVVNDGATGDLASFGLTEPTSEMEVAFDGEAPERVRVIFGARNPTRTALYAKRADAPTVYLVGLNVRYYEDLIFEAAGVSATSAAKRTNTAV